MEQGKTSPRVLVVDDDPHLLNLLDLRLAEQGFDVMLASSAQEALTKVEGKRPDIVIADIMMPGMDGYELCERVRANEKLQNIPFIFLSALADTQDKVRGLKLGADDYLTKPFEFHELLARIEILLDRYSRYQETFEQATEIATAGNIEDLGVIDLLQMLSFGQKTGEVHLKSDEEEGFLYLMSGKLIAATCRSKQGRAALPTLLSWSKGRFRVKLTDSLSLTPTIETQTDEAIFAALRELDETERIKQELGQRSIPVFTAKPRPEARVEEVLLQLVDGNRSIKEVLAASPLSIFETVEAIKKMVGKGQIELRPGEKAAPKGMAPPEPEAKEPPDEEAWEPKLPIEVEGAEATKETVPLEKAKPPKEVAAPAGPQVEVKEKLPPQEFNLIVIGTNRDSRNTFIHTVSGEEEPMKPEETVLNFGRIMMGPHQLNLYGLPGAKRFAPLWQTFIQRVHGMIVLANASIEEEVDNLRFALSLLGPHIPGPKIVINTDPTHPEIELGPESHGAKAVTCLSSDRIKAAGIVKNLIAELTR
jgi:DNA-binding response OmpR family regulator